jgi:hypothetical protein
MSLEAVLHPDPTLQCRSGSSYKICVKRRNLLRLAIFKGNYYIFKYIFSSFSLFAYNNMQILKFKEIPHTGILLAAVNQAHGSGSKLMFLSGSGSEKKKKKDANPQH